MAQMSQMTHLGFSVLWDCNKCSSQAKKPVCDIVPQNEGKVVFTGAKICALLCS